MRLHLRDGRYIIRKFQPRLQEVSPLAYIACWTHSLQESASTGTSVVHGLGWQHPGVNAASVVVVPKGHSRSGWSAMLLASGYLSGAISWLL